MNARDNRAHAKQKLTRTGLSVSVAAAVALLVGCSGGGGDSAEATLSSQDVISQLTAAYPDAESNVAVQLGFSPVENKTCDILAHNSPGTTVCIDIDAAASFEGHPSIDLSGRSIGYYSALPAGLTQAQLDARLATVDAAVKKPTFTNAFPVDFGTHDNHNSYTPIGEVCVDDEDNASVSLVATTDSGVYDMTAKGNGCFTLPDVTSDGVGTHSVTVLDASSNAGSVSLEGDLGSYTVNAYANQLPEANISLVGDYSVIDEQIRDVNGSVVFECTGSDAEDGEPELSGKHKFADETTYTPAVLDENNRFTVTVSTSGGKELVAVCTSTDTFSVSVDANVSVGIHQNTAAYSANPDAFANVNITEGESVYFPALSCSDDENDTTSSSQTYSGDNVFNVVGTYDNNLTCTDAYGARTSQTQRIIVGEIPNPPATLSVNNVSCTPNDLVTLIYTANDNSGIASTSFPTGETFTCPAPSFNTYTATATANDGDTATANYDVNSSCPSGQVWDGIFGQCNFP